MSFIFGVESYLQGTWAMMKAKKILYILLQKSNTTNYDYMKEFYSYVKVVKSYVVKTPIHPGLVKANLLDVVVQDSDNPTPELK